MAIARTGTAETSNGSNAMQALMIPVAGPYRSGTNDDPALIAANEVPLQPTLPLLPP